MIYVDRVIHDRQVLHRHHAASLCSRATLMRRLREGRWWRPTDWTVALRTEFPDPDFDLLVASAHVWPDGGIGGTSLPALFGLAPAPERIEVSFPIDRRANPSPNLVVRRRSLLSLAPWRIASGREVAIDVGASSITAATAVGLTIADTAWLVIRSFDALVAKESRQMQAARIDTYKSAAGESVSEALQAVSRAVGGGCESAGEVYVWFLLDSLGVRFRTQHHLSVNRELRLHIGADEIRTDFVLEGEVLLEVDSGLHQHIKDVRRDLWNLTEGRRTLRIVGADVIADPVRAQAQLAQALRVLGIPIRPSPLPAWLTAA